MAEVEITVMEEVRELKNEIKVLRQQLDKPNAPKEELLTYEMLGRYQYVVNQQGWPWRWEHVSALYKPVDRIPAWAVENSVMKTWASGKEDLPNSFWGWDAEETVPGMALMLSRGSSCLGVENDLEGEKIYSTLVVFVHLRQELVSIREGTACLVATVEQAEPTGASVKADSTKSDVTVLCRLPTSKCGRYFPSSRNYAHLVLPYVGKKGTPKKLRLDLPMCYNHQLVVRWLHRWQGKLDDLALLPPVFSKDPTIPILLPVGYIGELWLNDYLSTPGNAGGLGMGKVRPSITKLACCHMEVSANKTLVDWTDKDHVVYPAAKPAPKDDTVNEPADEMVNDQDDEDDNANNDADDQPADDDNEHDDDDDESDKNATPRKEDDESEDESDDEPKSPRDQSAVSRDSGLGSSSAGPGAGVSGSVDALVIHPAVRYDDSLPLPTRLPSMMTLEALANDLYAYSGELFCGLEDTNMAMLDRILSGFKKSGGCACDYIHETAAIALSFFNKASEMEAELELSEVLKFRNAINGMKDSVRELIR